MATGPEHYQEAERRVAEAERIVHPEAETAVLRMAQVHAMLALAAATALGTDQSNEDLAAWNDVAGVPRKSPGKPRIIGPSSEARR